MFLKLSSNLVRKVSPNIAIYRLVGTELKFADIYFSEFSSFIFKVPVEKVVIDEEELHGIDVGELARNIAKKKKPDGFKSL